jgi:hypothetical protein
MKEKEKANRLLQFTQRISYNSNSDEEASGETEKQAAPPLPLTSEDGELARLGIRPLDSQRYADKVVREAGLLDKESTSGERVIEGGSSSTKAVKPSPAGSVPNPDPRVFRPPGSGSTSQRYESGSGSGSGTGSFYHLESYYFVTLCKRTFKK